MLIISISLMVSICQLLFSSKIHKGRRTHGKNRGKKKDNTYTIPKTEKQKQKQNIGRGMWGYTPLYVTSPYFPSLSSSSRGFADELEPDAIPMAWVWVNLCSCIMRA